MNFQSYDSDLVWQPAAGLASGLAVGMRDDAYIIASIYIIM